MAHKNKDIGWLDIVKRLNEMSNFTPEQERQELMEAARQEPKILDDKEVTLADIAKLAGIKEYTKQPKVSPEAKQLVESITNDQSIITKAIQESDSDESISAKITRTVSEDSKRLDKIAELESQLAELKAEQKEEQTYDAKSFREVIGKDIQEYIKNAEEAQLVELYNTFSDNEAVYNEESSNILITTPETKQIIADAEKAIDEKVKDGEMYDRNKEEPHRPEQSGEEEAEDKSDDKDEEGEVPMLDPEFDEASGHEGSSEAHRHQIKLAGDFDIESGVTDQTAEDVGKKLADAGIEAEVTPSENDFASVDIHTMASKDTVLNALSDMVDEQQEEIKYTNDLSEEK